VKKGKWVAVGLVVAALGGGGAWALGWVKASDAVPAGKVVEIAKGELVDVAVASGTIEATTQVEVKSRGSGEVIAILVQEGDQVQAGQLLVQLDPDDAERALRSANNSLTRVQADVASANASLRAAKLDVEKKSIDEATSTRGTSLGLVSDQATLDAVYASRSAGITVSQRQAALASSVAQLEAAKVSVEDAQRNLSFTEITAPIGGTVLSIGVEKGTIVASALTNVGGGTAVVTLADLDDLRVVGSVDEAQIGRVAVEQEVTVRVDAYADRTFSGRVDRVASLGTTVSNVVTFNVEVVITDEELSLLKPGMSADLEIVTNRIEDAVLVPLLAIRSEGGRRTVTLASGEIRVLKTGSTDGTNIVVKSGLEAGEKVLIAPLTATVATAKTTQRQGGMGAPPGMMGGGR
jgi:HlyD family secretion protein